VSYIQVDAFRIHIRTQWILTEFSSTLSFLTQERSTYNRSSSIIGSHRRSIDVEIADHWSVSKWWLQSETKSKITKWLF